MLKLNRQSNPSNTVIIRNCPHCIGTMLKQSTILIYYQVYIIYYFIFTVIITVLLYVFNNFYYIVHLLLSVHLLKLHINSLLIKIDVYVLNSVPDSLYTHLVIFCDHHFHTQDCKRIYYQLLF